MPVVRSNERSEAIKIITQINSYLHDKSWCIVNAGGESTITDGRKHMFPDVILYGDVAQTKIMQGWELKMPDVPITDLAFIEDAQRKAIALGLNSCLIWNFTSAVLYERTSDNTFREIKRWNDTCHIRTRQDVAIFRDDWVALLQQILADINGFFLRGIFVSASIGEVVSDTIQSEIISRNKGLLADLLKQAGIRDTHVHATVLRWWEQVKAEYVTDEMDAYVAYSRIVLLNWANRILFAHLIKRQHNVARTIENLTSESTPEQANMAFGTISRMCDFYSIFAPLSHNSILPVDTWRDLMELNTFLAGNAVTSFSQASLQTVMERTVAAGKRELIGQYATPEKLATILTGITLQDLNSDCIDPCCGTGSIAQSILKYKMERGISPKDAFTTTWASDKYSFPLQITSISMARIDAINQPLRVFQQNAFELSQLAAIDIVEPAKGNVETFVVPKFGAIISNLPFVPFEIINEDEKIHMSSIAQMAENDTGIRLDAKSDLYQYLILSLWKCLKNGGQAGFVTSNSWLGTKAGKLFFEILGFYYDINQIHISGCGRWFHNADIVTVILVLTKKASPTKPKRTDVTQFCIWRKSIQEMNAADMGALIIDSILGENGHCDTISMTTYTVFDIDRLLSYGVSINALFHDIGWLNQINKKMCPISKYLDVTRGERRGSNPFFYPAQVRDIECAYIKPILKSSQDLKSLHAHADKVGFFCSESTQELRAKKHFGALAWIEAHEGILANSQSVKRTGYYWYEMRITDANSAEFVTSVNPDKRLFFAVFDEPQFVDQRVAALRCKDSSNKQILHALLNSLLGMFYLEAIGFGRGLGALDINPTKIGNMRILDPALLDGAKKKAILSRFSSLLHRDVLSVEEELHQTDRIAFDHAVLQAFGIDDYYDSIKNALLSMQQIRRTVKL